MAQRQKMQGQMPSMFGGGMSTGQRQTPPQNLSPFVPMARAPVTAKPKPRRKAYKKRKR